MSTFLKLHKSNQFWACDFHSCIPVDDVQRLWTPSARIVCHVLPTLPHPFPKQTSKHWPRVFETLYEYDAIACDPISVVLQSLRTAFVYRVNFTMHCGCALNMYADHLSPFGVCTSVDLEKFMIICSFIRVCVCVCVCAPPLSVLWEISLLLQYLGSLFHVICCLSLP